MSSRAGWTRRRPARPRERRGTARGPASRPTLGKRSTARERRAGSGVVAEEVVDSRRSRPRTAPARLVAELLEALEGVGHERPAVRRRPRSHAMCPSSERRRLRRLVACVLGTPSGARFGLAAGLVELARVPERLGAPERGSRRVAPARACRRAGRGRAASPRRRGRGPRSRGEVEQEPRGGVVVAGVERG